MRTRPRRSIVKQLQVREVAASVVTYLVATFHYLQSMPTAPIACFGVYLDGTLVGAVVVTAGARNAYKLLRGSPPGSVATLARLWLSDEVPANAESRVLAVVTRLLARHHGMKAVVSYADPTAGHRGVIYQAAGWDYLGETAPERYLQDADGRLHHRRSIATRHGTNAAWRLRARGVDVRSVVVPPKHRYCAVLDRNWRWRLSMPTQPYPKGHD